MQKKEKEEGLKELYNGCTSAPLKEIPKELLELIG
jgi:hypothetical protein